MKSGVNASDLRSVGGWLMAMVIVLMYLGPLLGVIRTFSTFVQLERQGINHAPGFTEFQFFSWSFVLAAAALQVRAGWLLKNQLVPKTIPQVKFLIWLSAVGGSAILGLALPAMCFGVNGDDAARGLISVAMSATVAGVYTMYLSKSRRVQDTYGLAIPTQSETSLLAYPPVSSVPSTPSPMKTSATIPKSVLPASTATSPTTSVPQPTSVEPEEALWASALIEFEGPNRRPGLWAKSFAQSDGHESQAKAYYLKQRVAVLQAEQQKQEDESLREAKQKARVAELAAMTAEQRAHSVLIEAPCEKCGAKMPESAVSCPQCSTFRFMPTATPPAGHPFNFDLPTAEKIQNLKQHVREWGDFRTAKELAVLSGYRVTVSGGNFLVPAEYLIFRNDDPNDLMAAFSHDQFVKWTIDTLCSDKAARPPGA